MFGIKIDSWEKLVSEFAQMANESYLSVEYMKCQIVDWLAGGEFDWVLETRGMVRDGIFGPSWLDYDT